MTKTIVWERIAESISKLDIAGYLQEEAIACLKYITLPKLKNIEKNLTCFCEYLVFLNQQNTENFLKLMEKDAKSPYSYPRDLAYFFAPEKKISLKQKKSYLQKVAEQGFPLLSLMQGMRGLLVLTIDEFCNASPTRIDIHKLLMHGKIQAPDLKKHGSDWSCKKNPAYPKVKKLLKKGVK